MKKIGLIISVSVISSLLTVLACYQFISPKEIIIERPISASYASLPEANISGSHQRTFLASKPSNFTNAAELATPAVVNIKTKASSSYFFSRGESGATGSGVIISPDGLIVTNHHVLEDSKSINITLANKKEYKAEVLGVDPTTDLALVKIDADNLPYLIFGNSDSLRIGEWVLAVGNPFNLESTVTAGIVSAKGRNINILKDRYRIESFIQTDAAVNPGNSGGALVNTNGELIGINTAIITKTGRFAGYSFAVPSNLVQKVISDLREFGVVQRAILGVTIEDISEENRRSWGLDILDGILISGVVVKSGAYEAGLREGDVVTAINDNETKGVSELQEYIGLYRPGDVVKVTYLRKGKKHKAEVVLKNKFNTTAVVEPEVKESPGRQQVLVDYGFELQDLSQEDMDRMEITKGVQVWSIYDGSIVDRVNMSPGFIITKLNEEDVEDVDQFITAFNDINGEITIEGFYEKYPGPYSYEFRKD